MTGDYNCPYPDCDWSTSRPADSEVRLTQSVVQHEVEQHRKEHSENSNNEEQNAD